MPSPSSRSRAGLALLLALGGCARPAPALPPAGAPQAVVPPAGDCADIDRRLAAQAAEMDRLEAEIAAHRGSNQALGYFSAVLFPPLLLATEGNSAEKTALDARQQDRDRLLAERAAARCPMAAADGGAGRLLPR